jgi:Darcynin, domain of unknown function
LIAGINHRFNRKGIIMTQAVTKPVFFFWLVKTTPTWLAMPPLGAGGRFDFVEKVIKPILKQFPKVDLRFFDAEAHTAVCSDVMLWTVHDSAQYSAMVEKMRETPFWDHYFQILHIIPALEDGYADHYEQAKVGG